MYSQLHNLHHDLSLGCFIISGKKLCTCLWLFTVPCCTRPWPPNDLLLLDFSCRWTHAACDLCDWLLSSSKEFSGLIHAAYVSKLHFFPWLRTIPGYGNARFVFPCISCGHLGSLHFAAVTNNTALIICIQAWCGLDAFLSRGCSPRSGVFWVTWWLCQLPTWKQVWTEDKSQWHEALCPASDSAISLESALLGCSTSLVTFPSSEGAGFDCFCCGSHCFDGAPSPFHQPHLVRSHLPAEPRGKPKNTEVGSLSLLRGTFLTQDLNQGLLHCRQILYQLSYQRSPHVGWCVQSSIRDTAPERSSWFLLSLHFFPFELY